MKFLALLFIFAISSAWAQKGNTYYSTKDMGKKFNHIDIKYTGGNGLDRSFQDLTKRNFEQRAQPQKKADPTSSQKGVGQVMVDLLKQK